MDNARKTIKKLDLYSEQLDTKPVPATPGPVRSEHGLLGYRERDFPYYPYSSPPRIFDFEEEEDSEWSQDNDSYSRDSSRSSDSYSDDEQDILHKRRRFYREGYYAPLGEFESIAARGGPSAHEWYLDAEYCNKFSRDLHKALQRSGKDELDHEQED